MTRAAFLVFLSPALLCILAIALVAWSRDQEKIEPNEHASGIDAWREAMDLIESEYVEEVDREELITAGIKGMTDALDRHSRGYSESELLGFQTSSRGQRVGIGIRFGKIDKDWRIFRVVKNSPADRAGLRDGDRIMSIDGEALTGANDLQSMRERIIGEAGEVIVFQLERWQSSDQVEAVVRRGPYSNEKVFTSIDDDGIAYIRLEGFDDSTSKIMRRRLLDFQKKGLSGVILDLRANLGGSVNAAVDVVSTFVNAPIVLSQVTRREREVFSTVGQPLDSQVGLVVLVDERSASASEIVAGALQDEGRALVVGARSYGKGLVQNVFRLNARPLGMKFTVARWYTPAGRLLQRGRDDGEGGETRGGIIPDIPVKQDAAERNAMELEWSRQRLRDDIRAMILKDDNHPQLPEGYADGPLDVARKWLSGEEDARPLAKQP